MDSIFLSVITRTKNRCVTLKRLREFLLKQSFKNFEWVIVNDNGDFNIVDDEVNLARESGMNVVAVDNKNSQGRSFAANLGVANSSGRYVIILDDDDFPNNKYFEKVHEFFYKNPNYAAVACWTEVVLEEIVNDKIINRGTEFFYKPQPHDLSILGFHTTNIPPCSLVLRRKEFMMVGGYPENIEYTEDWAFITNFVVNGGDIGLIPEVLVRYSKRVDPQGYYKNTTSDAVGLQRHLTDEIIWKNERIRKSMAVQNQNAMSDIVTYGNLNLRLNTVIEQIVIVQRQLNNLENELKGKVAIGSLFSPARKYIIAPLRSLLRKMKNIIRKILQPVT
ncbi:MAG: glycosyltransferase family A protein [Neisseriaceae bacterium]